MKKIIRHPITIVALVLIGIGLLSWGGIALYNAGAKNALEDELTNVNNQLQNTNSRTNPDDHLKLLARRTAIQELLKKY